MFNVSGTLELLMEKKCIMNLRMCTIKDKFSENLFANIYGGVQFLEHCRLKIFIRKTFRKFISQNISAQLILIF